MIKEIIHTNKEDEIQSYWNELLSNYTGEINMMFSVNLNNQFNPVIQFKSIINEELYSQTKNLLHQVEISKYALFDAVIGILLHRYNFSNDVIFSKIVNHKLSNLTNIVPVRVQVTERDTVKSLINKMENQHMQSMQYMNNLYSDMLSINSLSDNIVKIIYLFHDEINIDNLNMYIAKNLMNYSMTDIKDKIIICFTECDTVCNIKFFYGSRFFTKNDIELFTQRFITLLKEFMVSLDQYIDVLKLITLDEQEQILYEFNKEIKVEDKSVMQLFLDQVENNSDDSHYFSRQKNKLQRIK